MVRRAVPVLVLIGVLFAPIKATGQTSLGVDFTSVTTSSNVGSWSLGWSFNVLNDVSVTHLGFYDDFGDGLLTDSDVGLWDPFGNLIASATVPSGTGSTLMGFFRMVSIAPISLIAGNDYRIAAVTGGDMYTWGVNGFSQHEDIEYVAGAYYHQVNSGLMRPDQFNSVGYFGPNLAFADAQQQLEQQLTQFDPEDFGATTSPEPVSLLLVGTGLAGIAGVRRRKKSGELEDEDALDV